MGGSETLKGKEKKIPKGLILTLSFPLPLKPMTRFLPFPAHKQMISISEDFVQI